MMLNPNFNKILDDALKKQNQFTNADRIRAMTDEELAEWVYSTTTNALSILQIGSDAQPQSYFGWLKIRIQENNGSVTEDEDLTCPFLNPDDPWYNGNPSDDFFCKNGDWNKH